MHREWSAVAKTCVTLSPGGNHGERQQRAEERNEEAEEGQVEIAFRLETDRLVIRPTQPDDRPAFKALTEDPEVMRYVHGGVPYSEAETDEFFSRQARQLAEHDLCMGALVEKASGRLIGIAGVQPLGTTGDLEIGWWLARGMWGRGYATEAGGAAMRHVLETLGRSRVLAIIDIGNLASQRVVARLGMTHQGRVTGAQLGHRKPEIVVDLFARERSALEVEAKYRIDDPAKLFAIDHLGPYALRRAADVEIQENTYFDTADERIRRSQHALRVRVSGGKRIASFKGPSRIIGAVQERAEWEVDIGEDIAPASWPHSEARKQALAFVGDAPLQPIVRIDTKRHHVRVDCEGSPLADLSLDEGTISAGGRTEDFREVEVELIDASRRDAFDAFLRELESALQLTPETKTKFARGLALLENR